MCPLEGRLRSRGGQESPPQALCPRRLQGAMPRETAQRDTCLHTLLFTEEREYVLSLISKHQLT